MQYSDQHLNIIHIGPNFMIVQIRVTQTIKKIMTKIIQTVHTLFAPI